MPETQQTTEQIYRCNSCGARIRWAKSEAGKSMPFDYETYANGDYSIVGNTAFFQMIDADSGPRFRAHFASCPNAAAHRKVKR